MKLKECKMKMASAARQKQRRTERRIHPREPRLDGLDVSRNRILDGADGSIDHQSPLVLANLIEMGVTLAFILPCRRRTSVAVPEIPRLHQTGSEHREVIEDMSHCTSTAREWTRC